ncbi:transposase [Salisaeta longa]|uniref:transposase n=1 Tax=Salisaeta longa TaxID=503170 RepID=UPI0003B3EED9|nr:transposase [Salisaeta longa]
MPYDPEKHDRQSMRLPGWDYRRPAAYFVTTCAHNRMCLFGAVVRGRMVLNPLGDIVAEEWHRTEQVRDNVVLDAFVVMPNHVHGIIVITADGTGADRDGNASSGPSDANRRRDSSPMNPYGDHPHRTFGGAVAGSLSTIMRQFKSMVTKRINRRRDTPGAPVWQRNFYEHIVRNRQDLNRIRTYIRQNPARWQEDRHHPDG